MTRILLIFATPSHRMTKVLLIVLAFIFRIASVVQAQIVEPVRVEFPARIDQPAYYVENLESRGVLLFYESTETEEGRRKWYFNLLDTNLREQWFQYVLLTEGVVHMASHSDHEQVILFFGRNEGRRQNQNTFELLHVNLHTNLISRFTGELPDRAELSSLAAKGNKVLIGLNLPGYKADLLSFRISDGNIKSLPLSDVDQAWIQEIKPLQHADGFVLAVRRFERNRLVEDLFIEIDAEGTELKRWDFKDDENFLLSVNMLPEADGLVVCGTFDNDRRRITAREITSLSEAGEAKGYYFLRFHNQQPNISSFWKFENFTNLLRNLPPDMVLRNVRNRNFRYRMAEPDLRITLQFFAGQLLKAGDLYVFSSQAFRPQYRLETRMDYDFYGRLVPYTYSVFEGYQIFAGLAAAFNAEGHLSWSASLELRQATLPAVRSMVSVSSDSGDILLASIQQSIVTSKIFDSSGKQKGQTEQTRIEPLFAADRIIEERFGYLFPWYSNYYLASGYQRISNNRLRTNNPRTVFYLHKLKLE